MSEPVLTFAPFELYPARRLLLEAGTPLRLGGRAMDILIALTQRAGDIVSKDELIARVWPGLHVEETNLRVHLAALRKALRDGHAGHRFITNVAGRGYAFVAPVSLGPPAAVPAKQLPVPGVPPGNLPMPLTRVIGRAEIIQAIAEQLGQHRFVTVVGPGGIGKTTVAVAAAARLPRGFPEGIFFVDLAPIGDAPAIPGVVASALGAPRIEGAMTGLANFLRGKALLLVLDNCEHVLDAVATLAETLLREAPRLAILATSREALRAEGEWVQRLPPLGVPRAATPLTAAEALRFSAVQLFAERAAASLGGFDLVDAEAPIVAEICRRLDGIALAIEFAAGRLEAFGLRGLAALLDDRFQVLTRGRRTALPRHQTLRATLDWSYGLLPEPEQIVLRRLSVFAGGFTLQAARVVVAGDAGDLFARFGDCLASLVAKSLVAAEVTGGEPQYRLLETTRAYAREKLEECREFADLLRRHAAYCRGLFERAEAEWDRCPAVAWLADHARVMDDLHAALRWAFSLQGDSALGVALVVAAVPVWFQLSLVDECLNWVERALAALDPESPDPTVRRHRMQLCLAAPGWLHMYTGRRRQGAATEAWHTALRLAEELGDVDGQMRAIWAFWGHRIEHAEFREALQLAERFCTLAPQAADPMVCFVGERMAGASLHFLGEQDAARDRIDRMLARYGPPVPRSHILRWRFDQRIGAGLTRMRILWLQGHPDQALREAEEAVGQAQAMRHALTLGSTLIQAACPVALLAGDLEAAERYADALRDATVAHPLEIWRAFGDGFAGEIQTRRGETQAGLALLRSATERLRQASFVQYLTTFLAAQARALIDAGRPGDALATIREALEHSERTGERWALAEFKRIEGEAILLQPGPGGTGAAETLFLEALVIAGRQGALSWQLRAATSLAALWQRDGRAIEARHLLGPVLARFTEGFSTADLAKATSVMAETGPDGAHGDGDQACVVRESRQPGRCDTRMPLS